MPRILTIEDDALMRKLIVHALERSGYEVVTASDGLEGLARAAAVQPDLIITDVMMPKLDGYQVVERLRRNPAFAHTPILVLTAQAQLEEKLKAFEAGADDHMPKPFEASELVARVGVLLRRSEATRATKFQDAATGRARLIVVHSLRGGSGCSSLAVNLALALNNLWAQPTLLVDQVFTAGQASLMLDMPLRRTWADVAHFPADDLDIVALQTIIGRHASELYLIAAPTYPTEAEEPSGELIQAAFDLLLPRFDYIVVDLPHNLNDATLQALDAADVILLLLAPELASVRAALVTLDTYSKLGYDSNKIKLALNWTFGRNHGIERDNIEQALQTPVSLEVPFAPDRFVGAINKGQPFMAGGKDDTLTALFEGFAFWLSKPSQRELPPATPTAAWKRVQKRRAAARHKK